MGFLAERGVLTCFGTIDSALVDRLVEEILEANDRRQFDHIRLYIRSEGGDLLAAFALLDIIAWSRLPVATVAMGLVASAALMVLMAGAAGRRSVLPRSSLLSHRFSTMTAGNHADLIAKRTMEDLAWQRVLDHYRRHTGINDQERLERELLPPTDRWLTPEEACSLGLVDHVLEHAPQPEVTP